MMTVGLEQSCTIDTAHAPSGGSNMTDRFVPALTEEKHEF
jgi:hypothetical protein